jgi:hypothetical protein
MYLSAVRVQNYKSFVDSRDINLAPGFNVIVGQNNSGKSALVEALSLKFDNKPHRSLWTAPRPNMHLTEPSRVVATICLTWEELHAHMTGLNGLVAIQTSETWTPERMTAALTRETFAGKIKVVISDGLVANLFGEYPLSGEAGNPASHPLVYFGYEQASQSFYLTKPIPKQGYANLAVSLARRFQRQTYQFRAERMNIGRGVYGRDTTLEPDARNLPTVLGRLQANKERYRHYTEAVTTIFPEITHISVDADDQGSQAHSTVIRVWTIDPKEERIDLAMPLDESGTGISQVLAILYVVLASPNPQTIVIDEPQSFLHPGAARKLIDVLKQHSQHQYILTTHSATIINAAEAKNVYLLRKNSAQTEVEVIDTAQNKDVGILLYEIGARLADVFGADSILWVEGDTEEICLPLILSRLLETPLYGTQIVAVARTGDFEGKHAELVFQIYEKLGAGASLLPSAFGYLFDRENRSEAKQADFNRLGKGRVRFTARRMYENYLLNPEAVAEVASAIPSFRDGGALTQEEVETWLEQNRWNRRFWDKDVPEHERSFEKWLNDVHGAHILEALFREFSEERVQFQKIRDSVALTTWILDHDPTALQEFADLAEALRQSVR